MDKKDGSGPCQHCGLFYGVHATTCPAAVAKRLEMSDPSIPAAVAKRLEMSAPSILAKAAKHMTDRASTYDKPEGERSMTKTVVAFNAITGRDISESEGWLLMQILKDVRDRQRKDAHADSLEDCVAYAALKAEARMGGR